MKKYLIVVECAIEHNSKFLIIKRPMGVYAEGLLAFPGGKIEAIDEQPNTNILEAAVRREVYEEVGLTLEDPLRYVTSSYFIGNSDMPVITNVFHCKLAKTIPEIKASNKEVADYYWLSYDEIISAKNSPDWLKRYMLQCINHI